MLDSIYHEIKITLKSHFCPKNVTILSLCMQLFTDVIMFPQNLLTTCGLLILVFGIISLPDVTSHDKMLYLGSTGIGRGISESCYTKE